MEPISNSIYHHAEPGGRSASSALASLPGDIRALIEASTEKGWWWDKTHNPFRGCDRVSAGCLHCWCLTLIDTRLQHQDNSPYSDSGPNATFHPEALKAYARDLQPKRWFTPSMSDPFHIAFADEAILTFFDALRRNDHHYFIVLTKRSERLVELGPYIDWPENVLMIVSVEDERYLHRIDDLRTSGAKRIGVSFEPLIGRIPLDTEEARRRYISGLDYVIVGGETAPEDTIRPMEKAWATEIYDACSAEGVPFFFKQWGDVDEHGNYVGRKKAGRFLDGRTHDDLARGCAEHLDRARLKVSAGRARRSK